MEPVTKETQWWEKTSKKWCRDTLITWRQWKPKNRPSRNLSWFPSGCGESGGHLLQSAVDWHPGTLPQKGTAQIIIYHRGQTQSCWDCTSCTDRTARFLSYNKATAFYYSKIMLLLRFFYCKTGVRLQYRVTAVEKKGSE